MVGSAGRGAGGESLLELEDHSNELEVLHRWLGRRRGDTTYLSGSVVISLGDFDIWWGGVGGRKGGVWERGGCTRRSCMAVVV